MTLIQCSDCGTSVSDAAPTCPKCGRPGPNAGSEAKAKKKSSAGALGGCLVLLVGGFVAVKACAGSSGTASNAPAKARPQAKATIVPIETLLGEYKSNEVRSDANYKGKFIQTTGKVDDVKKDILGKIYVTVGTGALFEIPSVQCFFDDAQAPQAAQLNKGDTVTVRGRVDGLLMNVLVKDCEFVK